MNKFGGWQINISKNMPQKVATVMSELSTNKLGCEYSPIAYLGFQQVNGTNHAVLAEQIQLTGRDSKNAVVVVINEQPGAIDTSVVDIHRIVESGGVLGGVNIEMSLGIPEDVQKIFDKKIEKFTGAKVEPFAYVGSQVTKGIDYILIAKVAPVVLGDKTELAIVVVNEMEDVIKFERVFEPGKKDNSPLGYAFTWL